MTSVIVKCVNCNVVINELLAFLNNVLGFMDEQSIHQLCTTAFSAEDVVKAKSLLCDSLPNAKKMPIRRKEGKKKMLRDLEDIICLMKTTSSEEFPIFVAKELHKLPPVTFDHVDVTRLLKDILNMQNRLSAMEEKVVTADQFNFLKREVENMKHASILDNFSSNVNRRRGACLQTSPLDSGPIGLHYVPIKSAQLTADIYVNNRQAAVSHSSLQSNDEEDFVSFLRKQNDATEAQGRVEAHKNNVISNGASESSCQHTQGHCGPEKTSEMATQTRRVEASTAASSEPVHVPATCAYAAAVGAATCANRTSAPASPATVLQNDYDGMSTNDLNTEWTVVQRKTAKRYKLRGQTGRATTSPNGKFKAADVKVPLFISNVSTETSEQDIIGYIRDKTSESVTLKMINMKAGKTYNAYKLFVSKNKLDLFLNDQLWPDGITFRRFVHFMYRKKSEG